MCKNVLTIKAEYRDGNVCYDAHLNGVQLPLLCQVNILSSYNELPRVQIEFVAVSTETCEVVVEGFSAPVVKVHPNV